jgi:hypothetical protein
MGTIFKGNIAKSSMLATSIFFPVAAFLWIVITRKKDKK